jgi:hypothetical protein
VRKNHYPKGLVPIKSGSTFEVGMLMRTRKQVDQLVFEVNALVPNK